MIAVAAYYNEFDPKAAAWIRELITMGVIADGEVDERSICDVSATELRGFTQWHFFAGIGVWSYAMRLAGWDDSRPVLTGSCPCQPFSAAGKGLGTDDHRHLWPELRRLIVDLDPPAVFGEQVASSEVIGKANSKALAAPDDSTAWIDVVRRDMEAAGYALGFSVLGAHSVGAPHIRQRLYFVGERVADSMPAGRPEGRAGARDGSAAGIGSVGRLDHHHHQGLEGLGSGHLPTGGRDAADGPVAATGEPRRMADAGGERRQQIPGSTSGHETADGRTGWDGGKPNCDHVAASHGEGCRSHAPHLPWSNPDWLFCRDGKWRPVESSVQPLADGTAGDVVPGGLVSAAYPLAKGQEARVMRLRGYGNAIVPQLAAEFIKACSEVM